MAWSLLAVDMKNLLKKRNRFILCIVTGVGFFALTGVAFAATEQFGPTFSVPIPTVKFTPASGGVPWIGQYIGGLYEYLSAIASFIAGVMFVIGGMQYVTGQPAEGKKRIENATAGLILTLSAYLILNTINFNLTSFKPLPVNSVKGTPFKTISIELLKEGDVCKETSECQSGLECKQEESLKIKAAKVAKDGLEAAKKKLYDMAESLQVISEKTYTDRMETIASIEKLVPSALADAARSILNVAKGADFRAKARELIDSIFQSAIDALPKEDPNAPVVKKCVK